MRDYGRGGGGGGAGGERNQNKGCPRRTRAETLAMQAKVTGATHVGGLGPPQMKAIGISCVSRSTNASQNLIHTCDIKGVIIAPTRATALQKPRPRARTTVG